MPETLDQLKSALSDHYVIERQIGAGGMATVFLARDIKHDRRVAVKVLNADLGAVLGVERFLAEIRVTANLQHPNLLPLFDSGSVPSHLERGNGPVSQSAQLYYVMPYVEGETLRHRIDREKQLPVDEALRIATAVASALDYAHRHGVIHRDLKPENILLHEGQPLVADFGIALAVSNAGGSRVTQTGVSLGTPQYMSPEQATGDRIIDGRTDIYSLGAVLYEMLTGDPPHTGSTAQAIVARVLTETPRGIRATRPSVSDSVEYAVDRALEKLPADRWATAGEFADALSGKLAGTIGARTISRVETKRTIRDRARDPFVIALAAVATLGAAIGVAGWIGRKPSAESEPTIRIPIVDGRNKLNPIADLVTISPDEKWLAYVVTDPTGRRLLFVRGVDELTGHPISGTENPNNIFFSPEGDWIGFAAQGQLKKVRRTGGPVFVITRSASLGPVTGITWPTADRIIVSNGTTLLSVPAAGGEPQTFTTLDSASGERFQRTPRSLGDGKTIVFASLLGPGRSPRVGIASLADGSKRYVSGLSGAIAIGVLEGHLVYVAGTTLMAAPFNLASAKLIGTPFPLVDDIYATVNGLVRAYVTKTGALLYGTGSSKTQLILFADGRAPVPLLPETGTFGFPRLSPDGKRLAVTIRNDAEGTDIWVYDLASNTPTKMTTDGTRNERPEWTADGKRILYTTNKGGRTAVWVLNADGSGSPQPFQESSSDGIAEAMLSPDGAAIVYRTDGREIWYRRVAGDTTPKPIAVRPGGGGMAPRLSPDGKWVAYTSSVSGASQVYVQPFPPTGARYTVTANGGTTPVWSRDGHRLYYSAGGQIYTAGISTAPQFSVTSRDSILGANQGPQATVHAEFDVAADRRVLMPRAPEANQQTILVHNWKAELLRRAKQTP
jgi:serine/threonine-protein kinase